MNIIIGFSKPRNFNPISYLIRKWERTEYSHVYVRWFSSTANMFVVYHAQGTMLNFVNAKLFIERNESICEFEKAATGRQYDSILRYCMQNAGTHYGVKQLIGIGIKKMFGLKKNAFSDNGKTQICSELALHVLNQLDIPFVTSYDDATPKDIFKIVETTMEFRNTPFTA